MGGIRCSMHDRAALQRGIANLPSVPDIDAPPSSPALSRLRLEALVTPRRPAAARRAAGLDTGGMPLSARAAEGGGGVRQEWLMARASWGLTVKRRGEWAEEAAPGPPGQRRAATARGKPGGGLLGAIARERERARQEAVHFPPGSAAGGPGGLWVRRFARGLRRGAYGGGYRSGLRSGKLGKRSTPTPSSDRRAIVCRWASALLNAACAFESCVHS